MWKKIFYTLLIVFFVGCDHKDSLIKAETITPEEESRVDSTLKIMQFNIWQEGTVIPGGFDAIAEEIATRKPDMVTFSEVRNYNNTDCMKRLVEALKKRGETYYANSSVSTGIISRHKILSQQVVYPLENDRGSVTKAVIKFGDRRIALYSAHLDWLNYACYLPRGYDGTDWKKLPSPVTDLDKVLENNNQSFRDEQIQSVIEDAAKEIKAGNIVLIGGDFNEPSYLDWNEATANMRDHQGLVVPWICSVMLAEAGYKDAYRVLFTDPVKYPGFTFPANNILAPVEKLSWASDADERDRIDFIYYYPSPDLMLKQINIVGPEGSIINGKRTLKDSDSEDVILPPINVWPTDHKALVATFILK